MISRSDGSLLSPAQWNNTNRRHRQSTAFISGDKKFIQIIHKGEVLEYQQSRLLNKCMKVETQQSIIFSDRVEVEAQKDQHKVFDIIPTMTDNLCYNLGQKTTSRSLTNWNLQEATILKLFKSNKCIAIVNGSFFPEHPTFISAH